MEKGVLEVGINGNSAPVALIKKGIRMPAIAAKLPPECIDPWGGRQKNHEEGLWRRTQEKCNKNETGWCSEEDKRRRMLHYEHQFEFAGGSLVLSNLYLWWHVCLPKRELDAYEYNIYTALGIGGWQKAAGSNGEQEFRNGDLRICIRKIPPGRCFHDVIAQRTFPDDYMILEITILSGAPRDTGVTRKPWGILATGIRQKDTRGAPSVDQWDAIKDLLPAQFELGCGPSVDAGIPPLHFLHDVYCVTDKETRKPIMDPDKDTLIQQFAVDPERMIVLFSEMYRRCLLAQPTRFHRLLRNLHDRGLLVGPVITNNFDRLVERVGLEELYVRRYEDIHVIPRVDFHPEARSLIVVGSHADRRRIQRAAREKGLAVVYIDPEGWHAEDGKFTPYPMESPQTGDHVFHCSSLEAVDRIAEQLP